MLEKIDTKKYQKVLALGRGLANVDMSSLEATLALAVVSHKLETAMECNLGRYNLSRGRLRVLIELITCETGALSPADLATRTEVSRGTMTGLIDNLEKEHLIVREASPGDRRTILVKITPAGTAFAKRVLPENFQRTNKLMQHLSLQDKETLVDLLAKVLLGLDEYQKD